MSESDETGTELTELIFTDDPADRTGTQIKQYRLLNRMPGGGLGEVYEAEQLEPVHRIVAVKFIRAGYVDERSRARFETERQAMALMDHPGIATVLDGGFANDGQPYFVMEFVKGIPITDYCDKHRLSIDDRLRLFILVCHAIEHAHQKAIIHRDLKPSNILVTVVGQSPMPKLIDFGLAKIEGQALAPSGAHTEIGEFMGTPQYMSPEQAEMSGLNIDTRTDIYSLGVLLYELLTGALPHEPSSLEGAPLLDIIETLREIDPPRPSMRLANLPGDDTTKIVWLRQAEQHALVRRLRGDLDWIVMKTLEKDRTRRYATASDMASDVLRHLDSRPVEARPPSTADRVSKFVRRHRVSVTAATLVIAAILIGLVSSSMLALRLSSEIARADREASSARSNETKAREAEADARAEEARARDAEADARRAETDERRQHARASLSAAKIALRAGDVQEARRYLDDVPVEHRNWVSRHLLGETDLSEAVFSFPDRLVSVGFQPELRAVVGSYRTGTLFWNRLDGSAGSEHSDVPRGSEILSASPDGRWQIVVEGPRYEEERDLRLYRDGKLQDLKFGLKYREAPMKSLAATFSRDGRSLAIGTPPKDVPVEVWVLAGTETKKIGEVPAALHLALNDDGTVVACVRSLERRGRSELALHGFANGANGAVIGTVPLAQSVLESVESVALDQGGGAVFVTTGESLLRWDIEAGRADFIAPYGGTALARSWNGSMLAVARDMEIDIVDARTGERMRTLRGHVDPVVSLVFTPDDQTVISGGDKEVRVWSLAARTPLAEVEGAVCAALSPDGSELVVGRTEGATLQRATGLRIDARTGERRGQLEGYTDGIIRLVYLDSDSDSGRSIASLSIWGEIVIWSSGGGRVKTLIEPRRMSQEEHLALGLASSEGGRRLWTPDGDDDSFRLRTWSVGDWEEELIDGRESRLTSFAGAHSAPTVAVCMNSGIALFDRSECHEFSAESYWACTFSPGDDAVALGGFDGEIAVRCVESGDVLRRLPGCQGQILAVAWHPTERLVCASDATGVRVWDVGDIDDIGDIDGEVDIPSAQAETATLLLSIPVARRVVGLFFDPTGTRLFGVTEHEGVHVWTGVEAGSAVRAIE